jgi:hypothetical protein
VILDDPQSAGLLAENGVARDREQGCPSGIRICLRDRLAGSATGMKIKMLKPFTGAGFNVSIDSIRLWEFRTWAQEVSGDPDHLGFCGRLQRRMTAEIPPFATLMLPQGDLAIGWVSLNC